MKFLLVIALCCNLLFAKPFTPKNPDSVILTIEQSDEHKRVTMLLKKIEEKPNNLVLVDNLLSLYMKMAKKKSDSSYMGYAKAFLAPYLIKYPNAYKLKMHQVDILQYTHHFDEALTLLKTITIENIKKVKPYLLTATIYEAKGDFNASLGACKKLIFRASPLLSTTCITTMQSQLGKLEESYVLLEDVYEKRKDAELSEQTWALTSLADMAYRLNKKEKALKYLEEVLLRDKDDYYALKKMSDMYMEKKAYVKVKKLLKDYAYVEALFLRETLAKEKLGETVRLEKETLSASLKLLELREEKPHKEDVPYFQALGLL